MKYSMSSSFLVLTLRPNDSDFQHIYITSLIHSSQFPTVIKYISSLSSNHPYHHHYIYALYRNKQHAEAATLLAKMKESEKNMGIWHLEAQLVRRCWCTWCACCCVRGCGGRADDSGLV